MSDGIPITTRMRDASVSDRNLQTRNKENIEPTALATLASRRDAMAFFTTPLAVSLLSINRAETHTVKPETRLKIREKLDKLREKAGALKQIPNSSVDNIGERKAQHELQNDLTRSIVNTNIRK
ncbi:hypothetical protein QJS04_geneDACA017587 [Acorus gramineus]|uniref:Uncharacterized protein n=1 Tax=Acorus gramineus TaxID=55184 RepID=A0AAV9AX13_ACOGR|nr:hypothetical protein QJS04_geneDACA017587 [Acorus gramineus]